MEPRHCVIPAAGLGTRFLPATKALPKELLPVLDRPVIQWGVEEAVAAGATNMVVVISEGKELIPAHFQGAPLLERVLEERGKTQELAAVQSTERLADFAYVYQTHPRGLGDAVLCAAASVGDHPFFCLLPDVLAEASHSILGQMADVHRERGGCVLALARVPHDELVRFGCVAVDDGEGPVHRIRSLVEKPPLGTAPSDLAIMGRYLLVPEIFESLRHTPMGTGGELQLTDAIAKLLDDGVPIWGLEYEGELLDVGTPAGWLAANVQLASRGKVGPT